MKFYILVALLNTATSVSLNRSLLQVSSSEAAQIVESWPSVAKCTADGRADHISNDEDACDHDNRMRHTHDGTVGSQDWSYIQTDDKFRPPIKCKDPIHGNPITCDHDDIEPGVNDAPLPKKADSGLTPVKVIPGGPLVDNTPKPEEASEE